MDHARQTVRICLHAPFSAPLSPLLVGLTKRAQPVRNSAAVSPLLTQLSQTPLLTPFPAQVSKKHQGMRGWAHAMLPFPSSFCHSTPPATPARSYAYAQFPSPRRVGARPFTRHKLYRHPLFGSCHAGSEPSHLSPSTFRLRHGSCHALSNLQLPSSSFFCFNPPAPRPYWRLNSRSGRT
jgi:hypothetical protein